MQEPVTDDCPFATKIERYVDTQTQLLKLKSVDIASTMAAHTISGALLSGLFAVALFMLNIAIGFWLSEWYNSLFTGFTLVAICNLGLLLVLLVFRKSLQRSIRNWAIRKLIQ